MFSINYTFQTFNFDLSLRSFNGYLELSFLLHFHIFLTPKTIQYFLRVRRITKNDFYM